MLHFLIAFLGIGLVIFVHELGHFLAARFCGVRVETFSIGMGPKVLSWKWGDTDWQLALLPIGGYVKMAGDEVSAEEANADPSDASFDHLYDSEGKRIPQPDELGSKTVGQRFLIFAGGVIMNVVFGLVVFPMVLLAGVPFIAPVMGAPQPGSAAWEAGLESGTEFIAIGGNEVFAFTHIPTAIALGDTSGMDMTVLRPGATEPEVVRVVPQMDERLGAYVIGIGPEYDPDYTMGIQPGSPAAAAGIQSGDRLLAIRGGDEELVLERQLASAMIEKQTIDIQVMSGGQSRWVTVEPDLSGTAANATVGIAAPAQQIRAMRGDGLAKSLGLRIGDKLVAIGGTALFNATELEELLANQPDGTFTLTVLRDGSRVTMSADSVSSMDRDSLLVDLAFGGDLTSTSVVVSEGSPAEKAGLVTGDRVVRIDGIAAREWEDLRGACQAAGAMSPPGTVTFSVQRQAKLGAPLQTLDVEVSPRRDTVATYGIDFELHRYTYQAPDPITALKVGTACTFRFLQDSWLFLQRIVSGDVSADNAGGVITIGMVSKDWAEEGFSKLFFFLCILSMNLAFLNVLPIPMLDGGHMVFLLIEKLKGSPVSPSVQMLSQMVGMFMLLFLMIYVTVNDVMRWFFPG